MIKPADKGGATVVMNRADYIKGGERQLTDTSFYSKQKSDLTEINNQRISLLISSIRNKGEISQFLAGIFLENIFKYQIYHSDKFGGAILAQ